MVVSREKVVLEPERTGSPVGGLERIHWRVCWPGMMVVVMVGLGYEVLKLWVLSEQLAKETGREVLTCMWNEYCEVT